MKTILASLLILTTVGRGDRDAAGVDLDRVIVPSAPGSPAFVLRHLTDFLLRNSPGLRDTRVAVAEKESF